MNDIVKATLVYGILDGTVSFFQFTFSPMFGVFCDRFGRKKLLIISLGGTLVYIMSAIIVSFLTEDLIIPSIIILLIGAASTGATSGEKIVYFAIISDITNFKDRAKYFSTLGISMGAGVLCGSVVCFLFDITINLSNFRTELKFLISVY